MIKTIVHSPGKLLKKNPRSVSALHAVHVEVPAVPHNLLNSVSERRYFLFNAGNYQDWEMKLKNACIAENVPWYVQEVLTHDI